MEKLEKIKKELDKKLKPLSQDFPNIISYINEYFWNQCSLILLHEMWMEELSNTDCLEININVIEEINIFNNIILNILNTNNEEIVRKFLENGIDWKDRGKFLSSNENIKVVERIFT